MDKLKEALQYAIDIHTPGRTDGPMYHHVMRFLTLAKEAIAKSDDKAQPVACPLDLQNSACVCGIRVCDKCRTEDAALQPVDELPNFIPPPLTERERGYTNREAAIIRFCLMQMCDLSDQDWRDHGFRRSTFDSARRKFIGGTFAPQPPVEQGTELSDLLPDLPKPWDLRHDDDGNPQVLFTLEQMLQYAEASIAADRAARGGEA